MRTAIFSRCFPAAAVVVAALSFFPSSSSAQDANLPIVSIYGGGVAPEFCPPNADCAGLEFLLRRTGPGLEQPLTVRVFFGGTAAYGIDYEAFPGTAIFPAGQDRVSLHSNPIDDTVHEGDETVEARLVAAATDPYRIDPSNAMATATIRDDDPPRLPPVVSLELVDGSATETLSGQNFADWAEFRVTRSGTVSNALDLYLDIQGTARLGEDYRLDPLSDGRTVRLPAGLASLNVRLWVIDDAFYEGDETVLVRIVPAPPGMVAYDVDPARSSVTMVIHDNESPTAPLVSIRATVPETREPLCDPNLCDAPTPAPGVFVVSRSGGDLNQELTVFLRYTGTAGNGVDYAALPYAVGFRAGASSVELYVEASYDTVAEGDETVVAELQPDPTLPMEDYRVDPTQSSARVIIHDNSPPIVPLVSIRATRPETQEPICPPDTCLAPTPAPGVFTISRSGGDLNHGLVVLLRYGGSAMPRADYDPLPEFVEIPAGRDSVELYVTARFDEAMEGDETVVAALLPDPSLGPIERYRVDPAQASARVVIHDRTPPPFPLVSIVATDPFAREGASSSAGLNTATFVVRRTGETNSDLTVLFNVSGTASNGVDYVRIPGYLSIPAGSRSARIVVVPIDDDLRERIETVIIELHDPPVPAVIPPVPPTYLTGWPRRAAAIIVDNDLPRPPCLRLPDGLFNVCLPVAAVDCFRVEATRDFKEWTPLCTVPVNEGVAHYVDPDAPDSPHKFYRWVPVACEPEQ